MFIVLVSCGGNAKGKFVDNGRIQGHYISSPNENGDYYALEVFPNSVSVYSIGSDGTIYYGSSWSSNVIDFDGDIWRIAHTGDKWVNGKKKGTQVYYYYLDTNNKILFQDNGFKVRFTKKSNDPREL